MARCLPLGLRERNSAIDFREHGYRVLSQIGSGQFSKAYVVQRMQDESEWVAKVIDLTQLEARDRNLCLQEAEFMERLHHRRVVKFKGKFVHEDTFLVMLLEYCKNGDFQKMLDVRHRENRVFTEDEVLNYTCQLLEGLNYIHSENIIHRDIKPSNILVNDDGELKIGDFGISKAVTRTGAAKTNVGTPQYMSPEICNNQEYTMRTDMWSLGCVIYEMCTLSPAFKNDSVFGLVVSICIRKPPPIPSRYDPELRAIVDRLLSKSAANRPVASELLRQSVFQTYAKDIVFRDDVPERGSEKTTEHYLRHPLASKACSARFCLALLDQGGPIRCFAATYLPNNLNSNLEGIIEEDSDDRSQEAGMGGSVDANTLVDRAWFRRCIMHFNINLAMAEQDLLFDDLSQDTPTIIIQVLIDEIANQDHPTSSIRMYKEMIIQCGEKILEGNREGITKEMDEVGIAMHIPEAEEETDGHGGASGRVSIDDLCSKIQSLRSDISMECLNELLLIAPKSAAALVDYRELFKIITREMGTTTVPRISQPPPITETTSMSPRTTTSSLNVRVLPALPSTDLFTTGSYDCSDTVEKLFSSGRPSTQSTQYPEENSNRGSSHPVHIGLQDDENILQINSPTSSDTSDIVINCSSPTNLFGPLLSLDGHDQHYSKHRDTRRETGPSSLTERQMITVESRDGHVPAHASIALNSGRSTVSRNFLSEEDEDQVQDVTVASCSDAQVVSLSAWNLGQTCEDSDRCAGRVSSKKHYSEGAQVTQRDFPDVAPPLSAYRERRRTIGIYTSTPSTKLNRTGPLPLHRGSADLSSSRPFANEICTKEEVEEAQSYSHRSLLTRRTTISADDFSKDIEGDHATTVDASVMHEKLASSAIKSQADVLFAIMHVQAMLQRERLITCVRIYRKDLQSNEHLQWHRGRVDATLRKSLRTLTDSLFVQASSTIYVFMDYSSAKMEDLLRSASSILMDIENNFMAVRKQIDITYYEALSSSSSRKDRQKKPEYSNQWTDIFKQQTDYFTRSIQRLAECLRSITDEMVASVVEELRDHCYKYADQGGIIITYCGFISRQLAFLSFLGPDAVRKRQARHFLYDQSAMRRQYEESTSYYLEKIARVGLLTVCEEKLKVASEVKVIEQLVEEFRIEAEHLFNDVKVLSTRIVQGLEEVCKKSARRRIERMLDQASQSRPRKINAFVPDGRESSMRQGTKASDGNRSKNTSLSPVRHCRKFKDKTIVKRNNVRSKTIHPSSIIRPIGYSSPSNDDNESMSGRTQALTYRSHAITTRLSSKKKSQDDYCEASGSTELPFAFDVDVRNESESSSDWISDTSRDNWRKRGARTSTSRLSPDNSRDPDADWKNVSSCDEWSNGDSRRTRSNRNRGNKTVSSATGRHRKSVIEPVHAEFELERHQRSLHRSSSVHETITSYLSSPATCHSQASTCAPSSNRSTTPGKDKGTFALTTTSASRRRQLSVDMVDTIKPAQSTCELSRSTMY